MKISVNLCFLRKNKLKNCSNDDKRFQKVENSGISIRVSAYSNRKWKDNNIARTRAHHLITVKLETTKLEK